ncbi:MAG: Tfp pilus assembly protein FimT/FimU [Chthoniobacteraceae bacterium]
MPRYIPCSQNGFTLLEVMLALLVALTVIAVSVPSVAAALSKPPAQAAFEQFDRLVQEARDRSHAEGRNYVIVWGSDRVIRVRPEETGSRAEGKGVRQWKQTDGRTLELEFPAALLQGKTPDAIWTFWADGACEPARVRYKNGNAKWTALYNPFTARAEVNYD